MVSSQVRSYSGPHLLGERLQDFAAQEKNARWLKVEVLIEIRVHAFLLLVHSEEGLRHSFSRKTDCTASPPDLAPINHGSKGKRGK